MPTCLYCKQSDRLFTSVEHVIPESLGNQGRRGKPPILLPKGVVCDKCNNGKLSCLDNALCDFSPIAFMRTAHSIEGKEGKLPSANFNNASMHAASKGNIVFRSNSHKTYTYNGEKDGGHSFSLNVKGSRKLIPSYSRTIARALFKMTLGCMYIDMPDTAMSDRFDPIRHMILGLSKFHGYFAMVRKATLPNPANESVASLSYNFYTNEDGEETVWCRFYFWGVEMFTDLEIREPKYPEFIEPHASIIRF